MKHFTSYYANYGNIPADYMCIGITEECPKGFSNSLNNFMFTKGNILTPSSALLNDYTNHCITLDDFKRDYVTGILQGIADVTGKNDFMSWITSVDNFYEYKCGTNWRGIVFMSEEKPQEFSHRHILRKLMSNVYKIHCDEFGCKSFELWGNVPENRQSKLLF